MSLVFHPQVCAILKGISPDSFSLIDHSKFSQPIKSPKEFANALGYDIERISKTILIANKNINRASRADNVQSNYAAACSSANKRMDTKKIADHLNWGGCEVATEEELSRLTGFPKYGVSPIGLGEISVIMENSLLFFETILIGAGQEALEIEISPRYLAQLINPQMAKIQLD